MLVIYGIKTIHNSHSLNSLWLEAVLLIGFFDFIILKFDIIFGEFESLRELDNTTIEAGLLH